MVGFDYLWLSILTRHQENIGADLGGRERCLEGFLGSGGSGANPCLPQNIWDSVGNTKGDHENRPQKQKEQNLELAATAQLESGKKLQWYSKQGHKTIVWVLGLAGMDFRIVEKYVWVR